MKTIEIFIFSCFFFTRIGLSQTKTDSSHIKDSASIPIKENITDLPDQLSIQFDYVHGNMIPHAKEVLNVKGKNPKGYKIELSWQLHWKSVWDNYHSYPRLGIFAEYFDTDFEEILGHGYATGMLFTYFFGLPSTINFLLKGEAGVIYLTKPYDRNNNPHNMSYCTYLNYSLSIGGGINLKLNRLWQLQFLASMNHKSNAAWLEPNGGINYPAVSLGVTYILNPVNFKPLPGEDPYLSLPKKKRWEISLSGGMSAMPYPKPGQAPMASLSVMRSIQVARLLALTAAAELEYNGRARKLMEKYYTHIKSSYWRSSVLLGGEFLLGKALFGIQLGVYFYREYVEGGDFFQRYYLVYNILKNIYAGISFKSYGHFADHLDLKLAYSF